MSDDQRSLPRGKVLWLDDPQTAWRVVEGAVDVFAVSGPGGRRYRQVFLAAAGQGRTLFGLDEPTAGGGVRLMAAATENTLLAGWPRDGLLADQSPEEALAAVEEWLQALLAAPDNMAPPRTVSFLEPGGTVSLEAGQTVRTPRSLTWVRVLAGKVRYSLIPEDKLPGGREMPLLDTAWLTAAEDSQVYGLTTEEKLAAGGADGIRQMLGNGHELFAAAMNEWFAREDKRDGEKLAARKSQEKQLLYSAAGHLLRTDLPELAPAAALDGPTSPLLAIARAVAGHCGIPERQVRLPAGTDPQARDANTLRLIFRLAGLQLRPVTLEAGWHKQDNGPLVAYRGPERVMVALLPAAPNQYRLFDPASQGTVPVDAGLAGDVAAEAYTVYSSLPANTATMSGLLAFLYAKCWPGDWRNILLISLIAGIIPVLTPFVTQTIFEDIIPINNRQGLMMVVQVMVVAAFATAAASFARGISVLRIKNKSRLTVEAALWLRLLSLPPAFFRRYQAGDLAQRMAGFGQIAAQLSNSALSAIFNTMFSFWSLLVMVYYSWQLTAAAGAIWAAYFGISGFLLWRLVNAKRRMATAVGNTAGQVLQIFNGLGKLRVQGAEPQAFFLWARQFGEQWKWNRAFRWDANILELLNAVQPILLTMAVFWLTMDLAGQGNGGGVGGITLPQFMAFNAALAGFNATATGMVAVVVNLLDVFPQMERLRPILEAKPEAAEDKAEAGELTGHIEVNNLSFRYAPETPQVLRNISLTILPGQFVAIVGASGSGKSTLLRLLLGFERPESGSIFYDRQELAELNITSVRSQMGVVLQGGQLMAGTILSNIIGTLPLTIDDAWKAAEMVGLAEDIRAMPMGMHTIISEGAANISGGQRQRILIARSIVHQPRIIVFDEATSALDNRTQAIVTESLDKLNVTRIVVAHRLSTLAGADIIYVLDKGQIVEKGSHDELMRSEGVFYQIAHRQIV